MQVANPPAHVYVKTAIDSASGSMPPHLIICLAVKQAGWTFCSVQLSTLPRVESEVEAPCKKIQSCK